MAIAARERAAIDESVAEIESAGGSADLTEEAASRGRSPPRGKPSAPPDIAINNVHGQRMGSLMDVEPEPADRAERGLPCARQVVPYMKEQHWGRIVDRVLALTRPAT